MPNDTTATDGSPTASHHAGPSINHVVICVRDLPASHAFYTEMLGFTRCGELKGPYAQSEMWFYRGAASTHHDLALVQARRPQDAPPRGSWEFFPETAVGLNHLAIGFATRDAWLERLAHLQRGGVKFIVRGNHGMTHSAYIEDPDGNGIEVVYDLPVEGWDGDVDAALSFFEFMPTDGDEALQDPTEYPTFAAPG